MFRLFPSGSNRYACGKEVFNSYGKRSNDNLLQDYGFAILDNEWDEVDVTMALPGVGHGDGDEQSQGGNNGACFELRRKALNAAGFSVYRLFKLTAGGFPMEVR
jgi:hypothetical protein